MIAPYLAPSNKTCWFLFAGQRSPHSLFQIPLRKTEKDSKKHRINVRSREVLFLSLIILVHMAENKSSLGLQSYRSCFLKCDRKSTKERSTNWGHCKVKLTDNANQVKCCFLRRGETGEPGKNLSMQRREPTNSTHI